MPDAICQKVEADTHNNNNLNNNNNNNNNTDLKFLPEVQL